MSNQNPLAASPSAQTLMDLIAEVLPVWRRQLATSRTQSEEAVAEMLASFSEISPHLGSADRAQVERMYVGFQYQDRISQIIALLLEDMSRMQAVLAEPGSHARELLEHSAWLSRLESQYAMAEQRRDHSHGALATGASSEGSSSATGGAEEAEFF